MSASYSTKESRVKGLQPCLWVLEYPHYSSTFFDPVLKVHPPFLPPSQGGKSARKEMNPWLFIVPSANLAFSLINRL